MLLCLAQSIGLYTSVAPPNSSAYSTNLIFVALTLKSNPKPDEIVEGVKWAMHRWAGEETDDFGNCLFSGYARSVVIKVWSLE